MDTFSDIDYTDNSEDDLVDQTTLGGQGLGLYGCAQATTTTTTFKTDNVLATEQLLHQQNTGADNITIIRENTIITTRAQNEDRSRPNGPVEEGEEGYNFNFKVTEKAKPKLPEADLLQDYAAAASLSSSRVSHSWSDVVVHKCDDDCACMEPEEYMMYCQQASQSQNSF